MCFTEGDLVVQHIIEFAFNGTAGIIGLNFFTR